MYGFNQQTEFILVGLKGKHDAYPKRKTIRTSFTAKSPYHSAKPDMFYEMLDVLEGDRIDIFARKERILSFEYSLAWIVFGGNKVNCFLVPLLFFLNDTGNFRVDFT